MAEHDYPRSRADEAYEFGKERGRAEERARIVAALDEALFGSNVLEDRVSLGQVRRAFLEAADQLAEGA